MAVEQLGYNSPEGSTVGSSATEKAGFHGTAVVQASALTTQLTTITPASAEGTPDYAIQALTNSSGFGFVNQQEGTTLLYVIKNLQERLAQVEAALEGKGIVAAN